jgi:calcium/calmodulin-dependent protein kinase kinase 2
VTLGGKDPLPSEQENCRLVEVTDEDMAQVVTSIPNLSTLILIKTMLKKHSFQVCTLAQQIT